MNNQCVPSWDLDETVGAGINPVTAGAQRGASGAGALAPPVGVPMSDKYYEVAELTWEKGNIFSQGLLNRPVPKYPPASASHSQLHAIGSSGCVGGGDHRETLEAVVGEAAARSLHLAQPASPWLAVGVAAVASARAPSDGLVPCARGDEAAEGEARRKRARLVGEDGLVCARQGSASPGRGESKLLTLDPCGTGADDVCGFTTTTNNSTSLDRADHGSPETEYTSFEFGGGASDSLCFSRPSQRDGLCDEAENVVIKGEAAMRSSISTKRSRAAAIHNESERKRRDRINQKMQTLQKLVPNSSKTDKSSMLDEVIEHLKQLQAQVQMMSRMSSMMMPMAMPQLQMSVMANMAQMAQMAHMGLGIMNMAQPAYPCLAPPMMQVPPASFVPIPSWATADRQKQPAAAAPPDAYSAFLACQAAQQSAQHQQQHQQQHQPNVMEAYSRMVAMYQKLSQQQNQPGNSKQ